MRAARGSITLMTHSVTRPSGARRSGSTRRALCALALAALCALPGCGSESETESSPAAEGLLPDAFARWAHEIQSRDTRSLVVLRNGRRIHEWHDWGTRGDEPQHTASIAKGVVGGLALALLAGDGRLDLDDPVAEHVPVWRDDVQRSQIRLSQLASHRSGLADAARAPEGARTWQARFWQLDPESSPMQLALTETPLLYAPGQGFAYSNPGFAVLSVALARVLKQHGEPELPDFLRARVLRPLGIPDRAWSIGYERSFAVEGADAWATWGGARFSPDALARLGELLRRRGDWQGDQVIPAPTVDALVTAVGTPDDPGWPAPALGWWTNANGRFPRLPRDAFLAFGAGHKVVLVVPSLDLVVVRLGEALERGEEADFWGPLERILIDPLMDAFPPPPVPRSEALSAWFDPASSTVCRAEGSDNWPITWMRDGSLFTSYGDGWGFEPRTAEKLSLGFARIEGEADDFEAFNVRSPTGERTGDGPSGAKASGLLAVDGTLYMWARNLGNAQLAWSDDGGRSWEWGLRFRESFGSPSFLNSGPDATHPPDGFVYVYSQDGPSAYVADDRVVLARAPRERIRERDAYQFFAGLDAAGRPRWTSDLARRAGVFEYTGACRRIEVVHVPGPDRYLMALGFDAGGGWGLFEAPEPWGPWRTVYFTRRWDLGDTHSYRVPTRWIGRWTGDGGSRLALVVSGRDSGDLRIDAFCVRGLGLRPL